jgi:hypothetical protein
MAAENREFKESVAGEVIEIVQRLPSLYGHC